MTKDTRQTSTRDSRLWLVVLGVVVLVAAGLRLWKLDILPPGLYFDEAFNGLDARRVATDEARPLYFFANNGREPLYLYLQALAVALLGPSAYPLRLVSAIVGIVSVPAIYFSGWVLFSSAADAESDSAWSPAAARWMALVAAAGIAVSFWHLSLSRLAFRVILLPLTSALAIAYFWRGWTQSSYRAYAWAGVWFAVSFYTYIAARLLPLVVVLFVAIELVLDLWRLRHDVRRLWPRWRPRVLGILVIAVVGAALISPLLLVAWQTPALFTSRTSQVSIFTVSQEDMPGTPAQRFWHNAVATIRNFYDDGDQNPRQNLPGRPVNDPLLAVLFTLGWLTALWRFRSARARLLLLWLVIMLVPTLLSNLAPHALRAGGAIVPLVLLYGLGAGTLFDRFSSERAQFAGVAVVVLVVVVSGGWTARDYFVTWAGKGTLAEEFDLGEYMAARETAEALSTPSSDVSVVLPRALFLTPQMRFMIGETPRDDLPHGEAVPAGAVEDIAIFLNEPYDPRQSLFLVRQRGTQHVASWLEPIFPSDELRDTMEPIRWPESHSMWQQLRAYRGEKPRSLSLKAREIQYPLAVTFDNGMELVGYDVEPDLWPRDGAPGFLLTTYWRMNQAISREELYEKNFDVFVHLVGSGRGSNQNGAVGSGYPLTLWRPGETVADWRLLPVPETLESGKAYFEVGLYDPDSVEGSERFNIIDGQGRVAGNQVELAPVMVKADPPHDDISELQPLSVHFGESIELAGWQVSQDAENPNRLFVDIGWRATDRSVIDYKAFVHLLDENNQIVTQHDAYPDGLENPPTMWVPEETIRSQFSLDVPANAPPVQTIRIGLYEPVSGEQAPITDADMTSRGAAQNTYILLPMESHATEEQ